MVDLLYDKMQQESKREKMILIMPGSRKSEMEYNCKTMFEAAGMIRDSVKNFRFIWIVPEYVEEDFIKEQLMGYEFIEIEHDAHSFMKRAYFGILKSGTTTLEAAMLNLPMVVSYKISKFSYLFGRVLIHGIKYISLPNLIYGGEVVKELIEDDATPEAIANEFFVLYRNPKLYNTMIEKMKKISYSLGEYPVTKTVAEKIYRLT